MLLNYYNNSVIYQRKGQKPNVNLSFEEFDY